MDEFHGMCKKGTGLQLLSIKITNKLHLYSEYLVATPDWITFENKETNEYITSYYIIAIH